MDERQEPVTETRKVPAAALRWNVGDLDLGDNGEGAKSAPFRMVARTGKPIDHWYWGRVVHDMDGLRLHKPKVAIDYAHDEREVIGYANQFDTASGDLVVSGALVPFKESDRATEIIHKQRQGVPYEASINFGGDGIRIEEIKAGESAEVNGYTLDGPGVVIREWPLRGIAVCPYGADANTSTEFSKGGEVTVMATTYQLFSQQDDNTKSKLTEEAEAQPAEVNPQEAVEAEPAIDTTEPPETDQEAEEATEEQEQASVDVEVTEDAQPQTAASMSDRAVEGKRFLEAFGDQGGRWYAEGKTFAEAQQLWVELIVAENEKLRQQLSAAKTASSGEDEPASYSEHKQKQPRGLPIRIAGRS